MADLICLAVIVAVYAIAIGPATEEERAAYMNRKDRW